jgi:parallel beta-helix repeat protein
MKNIRVPINAFVGFSIFWALTGAVWSADCGGAGTAKVPCSCGDTVVASTTLDPVVDPVVSTNDNDFCPGDGLIINTINVNLNLGGQIIRGSGLGVGVGIKIDGLNVDKVQVRNGGIKAFETGIATTDGSSTNRSTIRKVAVSDSLLLGISLVGDTNTLDAVDSLINGDTGVLVQGNDTTLLFVRSSQNGNHGIEVIGDGTVLRSGQVNRNFGNGMQLTGIGSLLDKNLATRNFDGIVVVGDGDGNSASLELSKNKAAENDGHGISVTGNNHVIQENQASLNGEDGIAVAGTGNRLKTNKAIDNGDDGLIVTGGGNINDGGNSGKKNDGAVQCQIDGQNC